MIRLTRLQRALIALASISTPVMAHSRDVPAPPGDMPTGFHEALQACAAEQGTALPAPGEDAQKPEKSRRPDRKKLDACMSAKGFEPPEQGHRPASPPPPDEDW